MAISHSQILPFKSVTKKTKLQTKKHESFLSLGGTLSPTPTKLGTVIEEVYNAIFALPKFFASNAVLLLVSECQFGSVTGQSQATI